MERRTFSTASAIAAVNGPSGEYASMTEAKPTFVARAYSRGLHRIICSTRLSHAMHRPTFFPCAPLWSPLSLRGSPT